MIQRFPIGSNIKSLRKEMKWTQQELAKRIGVSSQMISNWEREYTTPTVEDIAKLAQEFNVSTDKVLTGFDKEVLTNYFVGATQISAYIQDFIKVHGEEMVIQFLTNNLDIESLLNSNMKINFKDKVLTQKDKKKIIDLIKLIYQ
ncbi:DNA-binding protein [Bacillus sp. PK3_68]|nr:DNA-binding protein [Bacillus sp. PK3_68]